MIEIIPAIDLIDGQCVRLEKGDYTKQTVYYPDPLVVAKNFEDRGFKRLHLVDLDGAKKGAVVNLDVLDRLTNETTLKIDFSGGLRSCKEIQNVFNAGAEYVGIGSQAVKSPEVLKEWIREFGAEKFLIGADVNEGLIAIKGWQEKTDIRINEFISTWEAEGIVQFYCTSIAMDGMMLGPDLKLYRELRAKFPSIQLIASGGVRDQSDIIALEAIGLNAAIVGKAFYESKI